VVLVVLVEKLEISQKSKVKSKNPLLPVLLCSNDYFHF